MVSLVTTWSGTPPQEVEFTKFISNMFKTYDIALNCGKNFKHKFGSPECVKGVPMMHPKWEATSFIPPFRESKLSDWFFFFFFFTESISALYQVSKTVIRTRKSLPPPHPPTPFFFFFFFNSWPLETFCAPVLENTSYAFTTSVAVSPNVQNSFLAKCPPFWRKRFCFLPYLLSYYKTLQTLSKRWSDFGGQ